MIMKCLVIASSILLAGLPGCLPVNKETPVVIIENQSVAALRNACVEFEVTADQVGDLLEAKSDDDLRAYHREHARTYRDHAARSVDLCTQKEGFGVATLAVQGLTLDLDRILLEIQEGS